MRQQSRIHMGAAVVAFLSLLAGFLPRPAHGQSITGTLSGTVADASGAVIPNAKVTATNEGTGAGRGTAATATGVFVFPSLPPGTYRVRVEAAGFQAYERAGIVLAANARVGLGTITLALGEAKETIQVSAEAPPVSTENADNTSTISSSQLAATIIRGRDAINLLRMLPGASQISRRGASDSLGGSFGTMLPNISGARDAWMTATLDGQPGNDNDVVQAFNGSTSVDAIAEIKVITNSYLAENGRNLGATVNMVTKSGTREFHGNVYWYKRHEGLNATNFFVNRSGLARPVYRYTNAGFTLGGPAYVPGKWNRDKNKLFFFYSQEHWWNTSPGFRQVTVPTELERAGDFSRTLDLNGALVRIRDPLASGNCTASDQSACFPGNVIPASRIHAGGQGLLKFLPLPNVTDRTLTRGAYNYQYQDLTDWPKLGQLLKLDWLPTSMDTVTIRPRRWRADRRQSDNSSGVNGLPVTPQRYLFTESSVNVSWTHVFTPAIVNEMNTGLRGLKESGAPRNPSDFDAVNRVKLGIPVPQLFPANNPYQIIPSMSFGGVPNAASIAADSRTPINAGDTRFHVSNNITWIRASHTFKAGANLEQNWNSEGPRGANFNGNFDFSRNVNNPLDTNWAYSNALLGVFSSYTEAGNRTIASGKMTLLEWFAQDTWKANRRLTLNYGLRFSYFTPWRLYKGQGAAFSFAAYNPAKVPALYRPALNASRQRVAQDPRTGAFYPAVYIGALVPASGEPFNGMVLSGDPSLPDGFRKRQPLQLAPKFGFAYDVFGDSTTAIRGGFGVSKQAIVNSGFYSTAMGDNPPVLTQPRIYYGAIANLTASSGLLFPAAGVSTWDPDDQTPTLYNWSLGIQRALPFQITLDATYVGNAGRHLNQRHDVNTLPYGARFLPQNQDPTTPGRALPDDFFRPIPGYGAIRWAETSGTSNYNGLQVQIEKRLSHGLQFGLAYTWSKTMSISNEDSSQNIISHYVDRKVWNYGPVAFDQTQVAAINYLYNLPNLGARWRSPLVKAVFDNWQVSGITTFASGIPGSVALGTTDNFDFTGGGDGVRPNVTGRAQLAHGARTFDRWFDTSVFARPERGSIGTAAPSQFRLPGINNWDLTVMKNVRLGAESRFLRLRGEFYNAWNHTQYSAVDSAARFDPQGRQTNARFGQVTAARDPRVIQLSASLHF